MQISSRQRLMSAWALLHPGPSLVTALAYAVFALLAAHGRPHLATLVVTTVGMVSLQFAISTLNDYCDRQADSASHKFKPLAQGLLAPRFALYATVFFTAIMVACYAPFGIVPFALAAAFLLLGFAYDLGVKSTPLGGIMLGLAFPLLPLLAWALFATLKPVIFWTLPLGLAIGAAIHLADALPDVAADRAAGANSLAQLLGRRALATCWLLFAGANALVVVLALTRVTPARPLVLLSAESVVVALLLSAMVTYSRQSRPLAQRLQANFMYCILIAIVTAVGWLASAIL